MRIRTRNLVKGLLVFLLLLSFQSVLHAIDKTVFTPEKGSTYRESLTGMEFVFVKGGCYQMRDAFGDGNGYEKPAHEICVDDFYMGKYEVTQGQWKSIMGSNPSYFNDCGDNCPVEQISWNDVQEFISKLNSRSGESKYRLPTEAEWEYAARNGGKIEKYAGGNDVDSFAWYAPNSGRKETHPVGTKAANGLGLYDMNGNVYQWVQDWHDVSYYNNYYNNSPQNKPAGPMCSGGRVVRGGSWGHGPGYSRTSPSFYAPVNRNYLIGFRLLRTQ